MFSRRRRAASNPPANNHPTPSAALAASQAFLKSQNSHGSLSSAAAAAALRSHQTTPEPVRNVQTKRTQRRGSNSSHGSAPALQRTNSGGSMTERTFRSPSPSRKSNELYSDPNAPPVPAIPANISPSPTTAHKRSSSMEPARVSSPPPRKHGGRGASVSSMDRNPAAGRGKGSPRVTNLSNIQELQREESQRQINFSRPMSQQMSPSASPTPGSSSRAGHSGWYTSPVQSEKPEFRQESGVYRSQDSMGYSQPEPSTLQQPAQMGMAKSASKKKKKKSKAESIIAATTGTQAPTSTASNAPSEQPPAYATTSPAKVAQAGPPATATAQSHTAAPSQPPPIATDSSIQGTTADQIPSANTSRKVDPPETEVPKQQPAKAKSYVQEQRRRSESLSQDYNAGAGRAQSISPARSARFSAQPPEMLNGIRHQPPPRSLSPAKSALKHSPSSSVRTNSPMANFQAGHGRVVSGDVSDLTSDDGKLQPKKKKSARVSFDEDSPVERAPAFGLDSLKYSRLNEDEVSLEEYNTPRPALPLFGSVRGRRAQEEPEQVEKITETVPSSMSTSVSTISGQSSDHAVGGVLAKDFAEKQDSDRENTLNDYHAYSSLTEPLPPEVTSVEGSGYMSDSDESTHEEIATNGKPSLPTITEQKSELSLVEKEDPPSKADVPVPSIALLPPTPAAADTEEEDFLSMPGGFPASWSSEEVDKQGLAKTPTQPIGQTSAPTLSQIQAQNPSTDTDESSDNDTIYSDAEEDLSHTFASLDAMVESPMVSPQRDAPIATPPDSPRTTLSSTPLQTSTSIPATPERNDTKPAEPSKDWSRAQTYWDERRKLQTQRTVSQENVHASPVAAERRPTTAPAPPKKKKKAKIVTQEAGPVQAARVVSTGPQSQKPQAPRKSAMRSSMRASSEEPRSTAMRHSLRSSVDMTLPAGEHHMRKSMRSPGHMGTSMRDGPQTGLSPSKYNGPPPSIPAKAKARPPSMEAAAASAAPRTMPKLQRADSDGSDSSFRRARRGTSLGPDGRYAMKRSMRGSSVPPQSAIAHMPPPIAPVESKKPKSSRFSIRSLSPQGRGMRSSMRDSGASAAPTLRTKPPQKSSKLGFGSPKAKGASPVAKPPPQQQRRFKSRFNDSDGDEDDVRPAFRSRFADSDDEDDDIPTTLTPVRGIPRRAGQEDEDSTDLEDESDNEAHVRPVTAHPAIPTPEDVNAAHKNGKPQPEGAALAAGSLRNGDVAAEQNKGDSKEKKSKHKWKFPGLGGGKKKDKSAPSAPAPAVADTNMPPASPTRPSTAQPVPVAARPGGRAGKLQKRHSSYTGPLPTAAPAVPAEPVAEVPAPPTTTTAPTSTPAAPTTAKPDIRRVTSDTWPLSAPSSPTTATHGFRKSLRTASVARPEIGSRRNTAETTMSDGAVLGEGSGGRESVVGVRRDGGRRKKFPMLRRAFGLRD
ncbi:hypothetical protein K402DRAFT_373009 [Aulographum hederae CBS 113979]|uniref:Uncharacterized protein n=1 Tax=Aulographum hederae CBS 113979 TaxID=1176131 RepID=A0A6G1H687_9PEZI|nr:hypothetical protein K402DRAFT_373009 [Aulographum hederae CBS 113979]